VIRVLLLLVAVIGAGWMWLFPDDVIVLVANGRDVLLGRYSVERLTAAIVFTVFAVALVAVAVAPPETRRPRLIWWSAAGLVCLVSLVATDLILRLVTDDRSYVHVGELRLRPPGLSVDIPYEDVPLARRSYANLKPGYPKTRVVMQIDAQGFRNPEALARADIILLGDSFTEGSRVTDHRTWAYQLRDRTNRSIYNLANSGDDPQKYLAKLRNYGRPLAPKLIVLGLYEGNDFRRTRSLQDSTEGGGLRDRIKRYRKFSPLRLRTRQLMINVFGPINADQPLAGGDVLAWLPYPVSGPQGTAYYAIAPKNIALLSHNAPTFERSAGWRNARSAIDGIASIAKDLGASLVLVYMPSKAHVTLPLAPDHLDGPTLLAFTALSRRKSDPSGESIDAQSFREALEQRIPSIESVVAAYCEQRGIPFVSLSVPLRQAAARGEQPYFTYDQHWTPLGHDIAAQSIGNFVSEHLSPPEPHDLPDLTSQGQ
jgi:hypothetical protein